MKITKEQFKELAKKHLIALEGYDINKTIEIFGVGRLYDEVIKIEQQNNKNKAKEFLIERSEGMTSERIKEIQEQTAYPESASVMLALMQVWNECEQEQSAKNRKIENIKPEFKAGDILVDDLGTASTGDISIFKCINADNDRMFDIYVSSGSKCNHFVTIVELDATSWDYIEDQRLATEEEKQ